MTTVNQIISGGAQSAERTPEKDGFAGGEGFGDFFSTLVTERAEAGKTESGAAGGEKPEAEESENGSLEAACAELLASMCPNAPQQADPGAPEEEAAADILEGFSSSGGKDTADPAAGIKTRTGDNEAIMARMPAIIVQSGDMESSTVKGAGAPRAGDLCPLENISELQVKSVKMEAADAGAETRTPAKEAGTSGLDGGVFALETAEPEGGALSGGAPDAGENGAEAGEKRETAGPPEPSEAAGLARESAAAFSENPSAASVKGQAEQIPVRASVENAMQRLRNALSSYGGQGPKELKIQLEPEHLGKLSISLSMGKGGLAARIGTENPEIQGMLSSQLGQLIEKLGESGIHVERMDVSCGDPGSRKDPQDSDGGGRRQAFFAKTARLAREPAEYGGIELYGLYTLIGESVSSVEYRA